MHIYSRILFCMHKNTGYPIERYVGWTETSYSLIFKIKRVSRIKQHDFVNSLLNFVNGRILFSTYFSHFHLFSKRISERKILLKYRHPRANKTYLKKKIKNEK